MLGYQFDKEKFLKSYLPFLMWQIASFVVLFFLRAYKLDEIGLHDHDAVMNFLVAKNLNSLDASLMFLHASPLLHLYNSLIYLVFKSYLSIEYAQSVIQIFGILFLVNLLARPFKLSNSLLFILTIFVGSSPLSVYVGRCIMAENGNIFFILTTLYLLYRRSYLWAFLSFSIAFGLNYKSVIILPFCIAYLLYIHRSEMLTFFKLSLQFLVVQIICVLFWITIGAIFLNKPTAYLGLLYYVFVGARQKESSGDFWIELDLMYYFKYLYHFENPLLLVLPVFLIYILIRYSNHRLQLLKSFLKSRVWFYVLCSLAIALPTIFLEKAPRIWIIVILFAYFFVGLIILKCIKQKVWGVILLFIGFVINVYLCQKLIYEYANTNYENVALYLKKEKIGGMNLLLLGSLQAVPFLEKHDILYTRNRARYDKADYILTDDYCVLAADCPKENELILIKSWEEKTLQDPFLYVEHSQYLGIDFDASYQLWQRQKNKGTTVRLYKKRKSPAK